jgi:hypothetical protein
MIYQLSRHKGGVQSLRKDWLAFANRAIFEAATGCHLM